MSKLSIFIIFLISVVSIQAQIVNVGNFKINSGTSVYFGANYTNSGTHTNDGDLHLKGNFTNNGTVTTSGTSGTTYFDSSDDTTQNIYVTDGTNTTKFYNLTVSNAESNNNSLAVSDNNATDEGVNFIVQHDLNIAAGKKLRLMGKAQLIQEDNVANTGTGHVLKDQDGVLNTYRYNYWSSPVNSGTTYKVTEVLKNGTVPDAWSPAQVGFTSALNGTTAPFALSTRWFYKYTNGAIDPWNDQGWFSLFTLGTTSESANAAINPGEGFCMKGPDTSGAQYADQNYTFQGQPNNGTISLAIDANKEYLVGNPYASALDLDQFLSDNSAVLTGTIYFYEHWSDNTHYYSQYGAGYATYNSSGGVKATLHPDFVGGAWDTAHPGTTGEENVPQRYTPVGQGFVVRSGASAGNIVFNNGQRTFKTEVDGEFYKSAKGNANVNDVLSRIYIDYVSPSYRHRHLLLALTNGTATDGFENMYDGEMIDLGANDMYFTIDVGINDMYLPYVIQGVGTYDENARYPLTIKVNTAGKHTILINELQNFDQDLYIEDEKGQTHNLIDGAFMFISSSNVDTMHFNLVFKPSADPTDVQDNLNEFVTTYYSGENIVIDNHKNIVLTGMQVYNAVGQLVLQDTNTSRLSKSKVMIPFNNFAQGAYIIKIQAKEATGTYKFINY
jgi:hypothetical protein